MQRITLDISICETALFHFRNRENQLTWNNSTHTFPRRIKFHSLPDDFKELINIEMKKLGYLTNDIRIIKSIYGIINPHRDAIIGDNDYTCIIYLTDNFYGGRLFIESENENEVERQIEVKIGNGVIFKKNLLHWNDELLSGEKIILLFDCEMIK